MKTIFPYGENVPVPWLINPAYFLHSRHLSASHALSNKVLTRSTSAIFLFKEFK
jgi:hypothetical protein